MKTIATRLSLLILLLTSIFSDIQAQQILPMGKGLGINGEIYTVKCDSLHHRVYASGYFQEAKGITTTNIAFMDSAGWHSMGSGILGAATAIEVTSADVFIGGNIQPIDSPQIFGVARWDGLTWNSLGKGVSGGAIQKLSYFQNKLFAIGSFTQAGDSASNGTSYWDGVNWHSFTVPPTGTVRDLFAHDSSLYLVTELYTGQYSVTLWRYNVNNFDSIASLITNNGYANSLYLHDTLYFNLGKELYSLNDSSWQLQFVVPSPFYFTKAFVLNNLIYALTDSVNVYRHSIRKVTGDTLSTAMGNFLSFHYDWYKPRVNSFDVLDSLCFIGGNFALVDSVQCPALAAFNGVHSENKGFFTLGYFSPWQYSYTFGSLYDSITHNLYVCGGFVTAGDSLAYGIARWDGTEWHPVGKGLNGAVNDIVFYNNQLYAAGLFTSSASSATHYIAQWDGTNWNEVAGGAGGSYAEVNKLAIHNNALIAGGTFTTMGDSSIPYIAQYNGTAWSTLSGVNLTGEVHTLKEIDGELYVGGYSEIYNGSSTAKFASSWSSLSGTTENIANFYKYNGNIYMSTWEPQVYKRTTTWVSQNFPYAYSNHYSQLFDMDGNFCASATGSDLFRYLNGSWEYGTSLDVFSCSKINDSTYFLGGFFPYTYSPYGYIYLNATALYVSSQPSATISASTTAICNHDYIFYRPYTNDLFVKYDWHFQGGFPDTCTNFKPTILYDTLGTFGGYCILTNWNGIDTLYLDSIHVNDCGPPIYHSYDNVWMLGYNFSQYDPKAGLDFYYGNPDSLSYYSPIQFFGFGTSICDTNGTLQLYSNGEQLCNRYNQIVDSSKNFNDDEFFENGFYDYSEFPQCALILPYPDHPNQYFIVHTSPRFSDDYSILAPFQLWYSIVDMSLNDGRGKMIVKQQPIFYDTLTFGTLQAERHANGRDWWIFIHKRISNKFYQMLLTPDGITQVNEIDVGPAVNMQWYPNGQSVFSPDGKTLAICCRDSSVIHIFHFDRCSGVLTFSHSIRFEIDDAGGAAWSCAFSPNNRFLYVSTFLNLYQVDSTCWTDSSCKQLIAQYDGYGDPIPTEFYRMQLAPDNKIYMTAWNGTMHLHVINNPDEAEIACNFVQHQLKLTSYNAWTIPVFPNFRVGLMPGSVCDTIPEDTSIATIVVQPDTSVNAIIFPNPSSEMTEIYLSDFCAQATITIFNSNLLKITEQMVKNSTPSFQLNISGWSKGIYFCEIQCDSHRAWKKLIVQ